MLSTWHDKKAFHHQPGFDFAKRVCEVMMSSQQLLLENSLQAVYPIWEAPLCETFFQLFPHDMILALTIYPTLAELFRS